MPDRAILFIDGNNWYHYLKEANVTNLLLLDYAKISLKLVGPAREWTETRYYIGRVDQRQGTAVYADQRKFVAGLQNTDQRISVHFGRIEPRTVENSAAKELQHYLHGLTVKIDQKIFKDLIDIAKKYKNVVAWVEKAVDVQIAVDMVGLASQGKYDAAYLLSADGDFTGAVQYIRHTFQKKVYAACPGQGYQLANAVNTFIPLKAEWFKDCYQ